MKDIIEKYSQAHWLFLFIALVFGLIYITLAPPLWGVDETSHFARVYQIAHGEIIPSTDPSNNYGGLLPKNLVSLRNYVKDDLMDNTGIGINSRKDVDNIEVYNKLIDQPFSANKIASSDTASYSPVAYAAPVFGVMVADIFNATIGQTLFIARLFSLLSYVFFGWLAIRLIRGIKLKWLLMVVALLPAALFQGSVVTADGMLISLSLLFIALFMRLMLYPKKENKKLFYWLIIVAIMLPLVKLNYIFLSFALIFIPNRLFNTKKIAIALKISGVLLAVVAGAMWSFLSKVAVGSPVSPRPDGAVVSAAGQLSLVLHNPHIFIIACIHNIVNYGDSYIHSAISMVGWNWVDTPLIIIIILCLSIVIAALYSKKELVLARKAILTMALLSIVGIVSIFGALYVAFNQVGSKIIDGVQGRYFMPFLIPIIIAIASYVPFEIKVNKKIVPYAFGFIAILGLLFSVGYYYLVTY